MTFMTDFELYMSHFKGIWLTRDPQGHDILWRRKLIDVNSGKYEWVLDEDKNVFYKLKNCLDGLERELNEVNFANREIINSKRIESIKILMEDADFLLLQDDFVTIKGDDLQNFSTILTKIHSLQKRYQNAITYINTKNKPHLLDLIKKSSGYSSDALEDALDLLQSTNIHVLLNLQKPDFLYPIHELSRPYFNAYFKKISENLWFQKVNKIFKQRTYIDTYSSSSELYTMDFETETYESLNDLKVYIQGDIDIEVLITLVSIDTEMEELKRMGEIDEKMKDYMIWSQKKVLLETLNYKPNLLESLSEQMYKKRAEAYLRKKKEVGLKKLEKKIGRKIFFNKKYTI